MQTVFHSLAYYARIDQDVKISAGSHHLGLLPQSLPVLDEHSADRLPTAICPMVASGSAPFTIPMTSAPRNPYWPRHEWSHRPRPPVPTFVLDLFLAGGQA